MRKQVVWGEGDFTIRMNVPGSLGKPGRYGEMVRLETSVEYIGGTPVAYHEFGDVVGMVDGVLNVGVDKILVEGRVEGCSYDCKSNKITLDIETELDPEYREKIASILTRDRHVKVKFGADTENAFIE